jgi:hypothetical protein
MRAKLATIEFERRMGAPERATGQLGIVVRVVERDHFQFAMTQQIVEGEAALGFLQQERLEPLALRYDRSTHASRARTNNANVDLMTQRLFVALYIVYVIRAHSGDLISIE